MPTLHLVVDEIVPVDKFQSPRALVFHGDMFSRLSSMPAVRPGPSRHTPTSGSSARAASKRLASRGTRSRSSTLIHRLTTSLAVEDARRLAS
jgi:hypothetical protein